MSLFAWYLTEQKGPDHPEVDIFKVDNWEDYEANNSYRFLENADDFFMCYNSVCTLT